jgi:hypothetical protein
MTTRRRIGFALAALVVGLVVLGIGRSAWRRAQEPKHEGRTADEWLDYLARFTDGGNLHDERVRKEAEIAFRSLGEPGQRFLIREHLSFERPTGLRTNLYAWGDKLPYALRPSFLRSPVPRLSAGREVLRMIRPSWETFQPEITEAFAAGGDRALAATQLMGYLGRGGTNAALVLVSQTTNTVPRLGMFALRALEDLTTNAAPAVPILLAWAQQWPPGTSMQGTNQWILNVLTAGANPTGEAFELLDDLFRAATQPADQQVLATALLRIQPDHQAAFEVLAEQLAAATNQSANLPRNALFGFLRTHGSLSPAFSRLARPLIDSRTNRHFAAQVMLRHDPATGVAVLHEKLASLRFNSEGMGVLDLLLRHDPGDEAALTFLNGQVDNDFFPRNQMRTLIVNAYRHCLPDTPGVVELLQSLQPAPDDVALRNAIRETLRHIKLNGKLKELRERDAADGR